MGVEDVLAMTEKIKSSMTDFRGKFDAWSGAEVTRLEGMKQAQDQAMSDCEHKLTALMSQKETLAADVGRVEQDGSGKTSKQRRNRNTELFQNRNAPCNRDLCWCGKKDTTRQVASRR